MEMSLLYGISSMSSHSRLPTMWQLTPKSRVWSVSKRGAIGFTPLTVKILWLKAAINSSGVSKVFLHKAEDVKSVVAAGHQSHLQALRPSSLDRQEQQADCHRCPPQSLQRSTCQEEPGVADLLSHPALNQSGYSGKRCAQQPASAPAPHGRAKRSQATSLVPC